MSIFLDKILTQIFSPLGVTLGVVFLALILLTSGRRRGATALLVLALTWGWAWSTPFLGNLLRSRLVDVDRYLPHHAEELPTGDAIVVLGGGVRPVSGALVYPDLTGHADRVWHAARLYHAGKAPLIIASGGNVWPRYQQQSEAEAMRVVLNAFGVPNNGIVMESSSRNTRQNAAFTAKLAAERDIRRVLLVTSLFHIRRAEAAFRQVGIDVIPSAVDFFRPPSGGPWIFRIFPNAYALARNTTLIKEYLGRLVYRVRD